MTVCVGFNLFERGRTDISYEEYKGRGKNAPGVKCPRGKNASRAPSVTSRYLEFFFFIFFEVQK